MDHPLVLYPVSHSRMEGRLSTTVPDQNITVLMFEYLCHTVGTPQTGGDMEGRVTIDIFRADIHKTQQETQATLRLTPRRTPHRHHVLGVPLRVKRCPGPFYPALRYWFGDIAMCGLTEKDTTSYRVRNVGVPTRDG